MRSSRVPNVAVPRYLSVSQRSLSGPCRSPGPVIIILFIARSKFRNQNLGAACLCGEPGSAKTGLLMRGTVLSWSSAAEARRSVGSLATFFGKGLRLQGGQNRACRRGCPRIAGLIRVPCAVRGHPTSAGGSGGVHLRPTRLSSSGIRVSEGAAPPLLVLDACAEARLDEARGRCARRARRLRRRQSRLVRGSSLATVSCVIYSSLLAIAP